MSTLKPDGRSMLERQTEFLQHLENTGNVSAAAKKAKIGRRTVYDWLDDDKAFKKLYEISAKIGIELLEDEVVRRAHEGVLKPIYQGGKLVGKVREYSDTLLIFLLKGKKPEVYKERVDHNVKEQVKIVVTTKKASAD